MIDANLLKNNVAEIVTEEELNSLMKSKKKPVTYCGYEVSGPVHIGTLVAINKQIELQKAGLEVKVLFADVHTMLNRKGSEDWINNMTEYWKTCFEGVGLKTEFTRGSEFQFNEEYVKDVLEIGLKTTLNRALRSMQEVARDIENAHVSQVIYPLMQIADIKALGVDIAHGGMEQRKIHMLAREVLPQLGCKAPVCLHTPLLCSLQGPGSKMSSSKLETMIAVDDAPDVIRDKIRGAFCPAEKEGNPVLDICELILFSKLGEVIVVRPDKFGGNVTYGSYAALESDYLGRKLHAADLKNTVAEELVKMLEPVRDMLEKRGVEYIKPE